jgi:hypothetical protein
MTAHRKLPSLVAELHAQFSSLLSPWESPGEGCWPQASIAIKANLPARRSAQREGGRGLGYGE